MDKKLHILVIDDDDVDRMAIARALKKASLQVEIEELADGHTGSATMSKMPFDCVLLDYRLPGTDGLAILRKAREHGVRTPIIMLTRQGDEEVAVEMMKAGASDYLSKDRMTPETLSRSLLYAIRTHHAEEELRESQERYAVAVQGANDGIWDWDLKTNQIYFSARWKEMVGYTDGEISNRPDEWWQRVHADDLARVKAELQSHLQGNTPYYECEHRILHHDGKYRWMLTRGLAVKDSHGVACRIAGSQTDITERKQSEAERERLYQQALEADRRKDEFLSIVSHELRTPLTAILGWVQLLRSGKLSAAHTIRGMEVIENNAKLQARIVEDLLDVSQILKGRLNLNVCTVQLRPIVEMAVESVLSSAKNKSVKLEMELHSNVALVHGDAERLQQVIWNLLVNAIKFTPAGGTIRVFLSQLDTKAVIQVIDNGCGIHPDFLPYIFDRFRQEQKPDTRSYRGLGLGLSIVRHLVELHHGAITAVSDGPGHGTTFTVTLPVLQQETAEEIIPWKALSGIPAALLKDVDVLVVEDDADTREVLITSLQQYGARVRSAATAAEALLQLRSSWPSVMISDIAMPGEDGYSLIRQVRAMELEQGRRIPSVALTAYASSEDRKRALSAGYQAHIAKPIEGERLAAVIARVAGR